MIIVGLLGIATMVIVMWEKFSQPEYRTMRAAIFVSLGLLSALPTIHFTVQVRLDPIAFHLRSK
jgi:predicted membrane channel-forming protein YqfA (hemolysin III family)